MHNARFRLTTAIAGATMCVFAVAASGQTTPTTTGTTTATPTGTAGTTTGVNGTTTTGGYNAATPAGTDQTVGTQPGTAGTTTGTTGDGSLAPIDNTATDTVDTNRGFPWGLLGLLGLLGLFKGRSTEVRRDTYATTTPGARTTTVGTGTAYDDRTATPRAASGVGTTGPGTGTSGTGSIGDPGSRR